MNSKANSTAIGALRSMSETTFTRFQGESGEVMGTERPILFSGPMVKAILNGRKTMTRRVVNPQPEDMKRLGAHGELIPYRRGKSPVQIPQAVVWEPIKCPYGQQGDRLWVRETWAARPYWDELKPSEIQEGVAVYYRATEDVAVTRWRPSTHMPQWASRLTIEITQVRVEKAEGIWQWVIEYKRVEEG